MASKWIRQKLTELKGEKFIIIIWYFKHLSQKEIQQARINLWIKNRKKKINLLGVNDI